MATVKLTGGPSWVIGTQTGVASNDIYVLPASMTDGEAGGVLVQIVDSGSMSVSMTVVAQSQAIPNINVVQDPEGTNPAPTSVFVGIPYRKLHLNGTAADASYVTTAITGASLIFIPTANLQVGFLLGTYTSGSFTIYVTPVLGSCAF